MADAALLLATEPLDTITGRVTYSQQILRSVGWIDSARGIGVERKGSGYSQILTRNRLDARSADGSPALSQARATIRSSASRPSVSTPVRVAK